jgi:hypothetical protein
MGQSVFQKAIQKPKIHPGELTAIVSQMHRNKRTKSIVQVLEHLPSKHTALNSNLSTTKNKKRNKRIEDNNI